MRIFDQVPAQSGEPAARRIAFYRCAGVWFVALVALAPAAGVLLFLATEQPGRYDTGVLFHCYYYVVLYWKVILLTATVGAVAVTTRRRCGTAGVVIVWVLAVLAYVFYPRFSLG